MDGDVVKILVGGWYKLSCLSGTLLHTQHSAFVAVLYRKHISSVTS